MTSPASLGESPPEPFIASDSEEHTISRPTSVAHDPDGHDNILLKLSDPHTIAQDIWFSATSGHSSMDILEMQADHDREANGWQHTFTHLEHRTKNDSRALGLSLFQVYAQRSRFIPSRAVSARQYAGFAGRDCAAASYGSPKLPWPEQLRLPQCGIAQWPTASPSRSRGDASCAQADGKGLQCGLHDVFW